MECFIVLTLFLIGITTWIEWRRAEMLDAKRPELAAAMDQALWDQYGPGSKQAYYDFFRGYHYDASAPWSETLARVRNLGLRKGFIGVREAPKVFQSNLNHIV